MKSVTGKGPNGGRNAASSSRMVSDTLEVCSGFSRVRFSNVDIIAGFFLFLNSRWFSHHLILSIRHAFDCSCGFGIRFSHGVMVHSIHIRIAVGCPRHMALLREMRVASQDFFSIERKALASPDTLTSPNLVRRSDSAFRKDVS
jgi:hypothetical protein